MERDRLSALTGLAVQFLNRTDQNPLISEQDRFLEALRQADLLERLAPQILAEPIEFYRLFKPEDDPMTFTQIGRHLELSGCQGPVENSLKTYVSKLVHAAQMRIEKELQTIEDFADYHSGESVRCNDPWNQVREDLRSMIKSTWIADKLENPSKVVEEITTILMRRVNELKLIKGSTSVNEGLEQRLGYENFISYVCGVPYEEYVGEAPQTKADKTEVESGANQPCDKQRKNERFQYPTRRIRPYELFLFGSQERIRSKDTGLSFLTDMVYPLSALNTCFIPSSKHSSELSILWNHQGNPFKSTTAG